jgi:hypothetical protein
LQETNGQPIGAIERPQVPAVLDLAAQAAAAAREQREQATR